MTVRLDRRRFLGTSALVGVGVLAGCGRGRSKAERLTDLAGSLDSTLVCSDASGLWPAEVKTRTENEYVDRSSKPDQFCLLCTNFVTSSRQGTCGTCKTVKGPINPAGWCRAFTELRARVLGLR